MVPRQRKAGNQRTFVNNRTWLDVTLERAEPLVLMLVNSQHLSKTESLLLTSIQKICIADPYIYLLLTLQKIPFAEFLRLEDSTYDVLLMPEIQELLKRQVIKFSDVAALPKLNSNQAANLRTPCIRELMILRKLDFSTGLNLGTMAKIHLQMPVFRNMIRTGILSVDEVIDLPEDQLITEAQYQMLSEAWVQDALADGLATLQEVLAQPSFNLVEGGAVAELPLSTVHRVLNVASELLPHSAVVTDQSCSRGSGQNSNFVPPVLFRAGTTSADPVWHDTLAILPQNSDDPGLSNDPVAVFFTPNLS